MAPSDKNNKTSEQLSERERKALIKQGQLRESDSKSNRAEEMNRSYVSTHLPGDNVQEIKAKFLSGGQRRKLVIALALLALFFSGNGISLN